MENPVRRLAPFLLLIQLLVISSGCAVFRQTEPPDVSLVNLQLEDLTLFEQRYRVTLRIQNPNAFALPIDRVHYEIHLEGDLLAQGNSVSPFTVPAHGDARFDVVVTSSLMRTARHAARLLEQGRTQLRYEMKGYADIDRSFAGRVHFEDSGEIPLAALQGPR